MVEISNCKEPCFAKLEMGCLITIMEECRCPFYKPKGCTDWMKVEIGDKTYLVPPEEYYDREERKKWQR